MYEFLQNTEKTQNLKDGARSRVTLDFTVEYCSIFTTNKFEWKRKIKMETHKFACK